MSISISIFIPYHFHNKSFSLHSIYPSILLDSFAFIRFSHPSAALNAIKSMNGEVLGGNRIRTALAKVPTRQPRLPPSHPYYHQLQNNSNYNNFNQYNNPYSTNDPYSTDYQYSNYPNPNGNINNEGNPNHDDQLSPNWNYASYNDYKGK